MEQKKQRKPRQPRPPAEPKYIIPIAFPGNILTPDDGSLANWLRAYCRKHSRTIASVVKEALERLRKDVEAY